MVARSNNTASQTVARKAYQKPTLTKAAVLTAIAADNVVSSAPCWVARAAFGETDLRWTIFRAWLVDDAPVWFKGLYIRYGQVVGSWLAGRENARLVARALMMPVVKRKLRGWQRSH